MNRKRDEWEEGTNFTAKKAREAIMNKFNTITASGKWTKKDPGNSIVL